MRLIDADALKKAIPNTHVDIFENCRNCRLLDDEQVKQLIDDTPTIELLKEQEAVKVQYTAMGGLRYGACPQCDARIDNLVNPKACGFCGQAVKWD